MILTLELASPGRDWEGDSVWWPEAPPVFKESRMGWDTPLRSGSFGDARGRKTMWDDGTRLGIKGHLLPRVGQRSCLSRGDYSFNNRKGGAR